MRLSTKARQFISSISTRNTVLTKNIRTRFDKLTMTPRAHRVSAVRVALSLSKGMQGYFFGGGKRIEKFLFSLFLFSLLYMAGCQSEYTPKPRGYFKVSFPEHGYRQYSPEYCPFTFEYPTYANIQKDTVFFDTIPENPCWMNILFPEFNASVYISYKDITEKNNLPKLIEDAHTLTYRHTIKADFIDEIPISTPNHVSGLYYQIGGNAASNVQFFVTDSTKHFIRGSLYFNNEPNVDSLAPVIKFVKQDINHLINTLKWKD